MLDGWWVAVTRKRFLIAMRTVAIGFAFASVAGAPAICAQVRTQQTDGTFQESIGAVSKPCNDCPEFVRVPNAPSNARRILYVARSELTWNQYLAAASQGSCEIPVPSPNIRNISQSEIEDHLDRVRIDWPIDILRPSDVRCYLQWLQSKTDLIVALPTGFEWEWFARASLDTTRFPWGDNPEPEREALELESVRTEDRLPFRENGSMERFNSLTSGVRVGAFPANEWNIVDLMGNSYELTNEVFEDQEWRTRVGLSPIRPDEPRFRRVLIKGSRFGVGNWRDGIGQAHFLIVDSDTFSTRVGVRIVLFESEN